MKCSDTKKGFFTRTFTRPMQTSQRAIALCGMVVIQLFCTQFSAILGWKPILNSKFGLEGMTIWQVFSFNFDYWFNIIHHAYHHSHHFDPQPHHVAAR